MALAHHEHHHHYADSTPMAHASHGGASLNQTAFQATVHCLTGCAIGEVLGMVIGTVAGFSNLASSLALSLIIAGIAAFPVNRWLIGRGMGHAVVHRYH